MNDNKLKRIWIIGLIMMPISAIIFKSIYLVCGFFVFSMYIHSKRFEMGLKDILCASFMFLFYVALIVAMLSIMLLFFYGILSVVK